MDAFTVQLTERLPLATATLELFDFAFHKDWIDSIYEEHRGRCYEDVLTFSQLLSLLRDALLQHGGSGHKLFTELQRHDKAPADESNFYRKLQRMPVAVSRALLRGAAGRLRPLIERSSVQLPACVEGFDVEAIDGKKMKNAAKRLLPTRGYTGRLLGAKALVSLDVRRGLVTAMSDSLDGEANEVPLVPALLPQVREVVAEPVLWLADRQFGDAATLRKLQERPGDRFVVRVRKGLKFSAQTTRTLIDENGRTITDETGVFGSGANAMMLRRITLHRTGEGEDDVILLTDLLEEAAFPALELLKLYRQRWGIETVFQEVTETFSLKHLIGCHPQAVLFQFSLCLLLYNLVRVIKAFVAADGGVKLAIVSTFGLFYDIKRELIAWAYLVAGDLPRCDRDAEQMRDRLRELLRGSWDPVAYRKASDRKPRKKRVKQRLPGGHTSVQRLLEKAEARV